MTKKEAVINTPEINGEDITAVKIWANQRVIPLNNEGHNCIEIKDPSNGLAVFLQNKGLQVTANALILTFHKHTDVSLGKLAKGKPLYTSDIQEGVLRLKPQGKVA